MLSDVKKSFKNLVIKQITKRKCSPYLEQHPLFRITFRYYKDPTVVLKPSKIKH